MRYAVVFALFVRSMITCIDRVCMSAAKEPITAGLPLPGSAMGLVFSAFALAYAPAQIPSGWFADKAGPRLAPAGVAGAWSALTELTGTDLTISPGWVFCAGAAGKNAVAVWCWFRMRSVNQE
jgi:ACS family glucarate transporter-like MFS transporter